MSVLNSIYLPLYQVVSLVTLAEPLRGCQGEFSEVPAVVLPLVLLCVVLTHPGLPFPLLQHQPGDALFLSLLEWSYDIQILTLDITFSLFTEPLFLSLLKDENGDLKKKKTWVM